MATPLIFLNDRTNEKGVSFDTERNMVNDFCVGHKKLPTNKELAEFVDR